MALFGSYRDPGVFYGSLTGTPANSAYSAHLEKIRRRS